MIQSFADADTQQLFREEKNRHFNAVARVALRKLIQMNRAGKLDDLKVPPGNRLEALKGSLAACICPTRSRGSESGGVSLSPLPLFVADTEFSTGTIL